jgi:hypothetical protein
MFHVRELGITQYEVRFRHARCDDAYATTLPSVESGCVVVTLATDWTNDHDRKIDNATLDFTARHETLHLLCAKLVSLAEAVYAQSVVNEAEEGVIRTLENYLDREAAALNCEATITTRKGEKK